VMGEKTASFIFLGAKRAEAIRITYELRDEGMKRRGRSVTPRSRRGRRRREI
jgi:hypothetical protein